MVLDCGGGTVDITVHKLTCEPHERFLCQELLPSSGGCEWGSKYVDLYFEEFLKDFFGQELFSLYQKNALARLDILKDFEILKRWVKNFIIPQACDAINNIINFIKKVQRDKGGTLDDQI